MVPVSRNISLGGDWPWASLPPEALRLVHLVIPLGTEKVEQNFNDWFIAVAYISGFLEFRPRRGREEKEEKEGQETQKG